MPGIKAPRIGKSGWAGDALVALSVSNIVLFWNWLELVYTDEHSGSVYLLLDYTWRSYLALILALLLLAAIFLLALRLYRNARGPAARSVLPLVALAYSLTLLNATRSGCGYRGNCILMGDAFLWGDGRVASVVVAAFALFALVFMFRKALPWIAAGAYVGALVFSPFALLNVCYASAHIARLAASPVPTLGALAAGISKAGTPAGAKTVFLLFDELDAAALYDEVKVGTRFEHFEDLGKSAVVFDNVVDMRGSTFHAIPLLTTGRDVKVEHQWDGSGYRWRASDSDLQLQDGTGEAFSWSESEHVFRRIRNAGQSIAILGYYHPYCRLFGDTADYCKSFGFNLIESDVYGGILKSLRAQLEGLSPFHMYHAHMSSYLAMEKSALEILSDDGMDFYWLHMPVPHYPWLYDAERKQLRTMPELSDSFLLLTSLSGYLDNVQLADAFLGKVVAQMKREGIWDAATLIVTSDHVFKRWVNEEGQHLISGRVPLLIKLPRQRRGYRFEDLVLQTQIKRIIEWIAVRKNHDPEDLMAWLRSQDSVASDRETPAPEG